jgi:hypothetical protein
VSFNTKFRILFWSSREIYLSSLVACFFFCQELLLTWGPQMFLLLPRLSLLLSCLLPLLTLLSCQHSRAVSLFCLLPALALSLHPGIQLALTALACLLLASRSTAAVSSENQNISRASPARDVYSQAFLAALNRRPAQKAREPQQQLEHQQQQQQQQQLLNAPSRTESQVEPWKSGYNSSGSSSLLSSSPR